MSSAAEVLGVRESAVERLRECDFPDERRGSRDSWVELRRDERDSSAERRSEYVSSAERRELRECSIELLAVREREREEYVLESSNGCCVFLECFSERNVVLDVPLLDLPEDIHHPNNKTQRFLKVFRTIALV